MPRPESLRTVPKAGTAWLFSRARLAAAPGRRPNLAAITGRACRGLYLHAADATRAVRTSADPFVDEVPVAPGSGVGEGLLVERVAGRGEGVHGGAVSPTVLRIAFICAEDEALQWFTPDAISCAAPVVTVELAVR